MENCTFQPKKPHIVRSNMTLGHSITSSCKSTLAWWNISSCTRSVLPFSACTMMGVVSSPCLVLIFTPALTNWLISSLVLHENSFKFYVDKQKWNILVQWQTMSIIGIHTPNPDEKDHAGSWSSSSINFSSFGGWMQLLLMVGGWHWVWLSMKKKTIAFQWCTKFVVSLDLGHCSLGAKGLNACRVEVTKWFF